MKTKELIDLLNKEDPSGELEVSVGNADIHFVETLPAYYDGCQQVLIRDKSCPYYNIIGAKRRSTGNKVCITMLSISDAIWEDQNLPIDYSDLTEGQTLRYKKSDDEIRQEVREVLNKIELDHFMKWAKKEALKIHDEVSGLEHVIKDFFANNLSRFDAFPDGTSFIGKSYNDVREDQWAKLIKIDFSGDSWEITKNE